MSGFEVAGIALAVFPILVDGYVHLGLTSIFWEHANWGAAPRFFGAESSIAWLESFICVSFLELLPKNNNDTDAEICLGWSALWMVSKPSNIGGGTASGSKNMLTSWKPKGCIIRTPWKNC